MTKTITKKNRIDIKINKKNHDSNHYDLCGLIVISSKKVIKKQSINICDDVQKEIKKFRFKPKLSTKNKKSLVMTKLYLSDNNNFFIYKNNNVDICIKKSNIKKKDIMEQICIYEKENIKLFIIVVGFDAKIKNSHEQIFIDMYEPDNEKQEKQEKQEQDTELYYDKIFFYNKKYRNTHLYSNIVSGITSEFVDIDIKLKLINIYYFLIGYI